MRFHFPFRLRYSLATTAIFALALAAIPLGAKSQDHTGHNHGPQPMPTLNAEQSAAAKATYDQYCALCHAEDRSGGANDHAPSLKSKSLFASGMPYQILTTINYGRSGTAMGGYSSEIGGPLSQQDVALLALWLYQESGAEREALSLAPVPGDIAAGEKVYKANCTECHGTRDEDKIGPIITNPATLATVPDEFMRYAIRHGRDGTKMPAFEGKLSASEIDNVTAYLRARGAGWEGETMVLKAPPSPSDYAINPYGPAPDFSLTDGLYVSARDLDAAMKGGERMILLDTRVTSQWQVGHISGAVPLPYYSREEIFRGLPKDTWIVAYCECPRAAAESVVRYLRQNGYSKTAVLYEGVYGWVGLGYPIEQGEAKPRGGADHQH